MMQFLLFILVFVYHFHNHNSDVLAVWKEIIFFLTIIV